MFIVKGRNPVPTGRGVASIREISRWSLTTVLLNWTNGLLRLINSMVTELIRPVNFNPGISLKPIKLEISSCRCLQLECNEESDETTTIFGYNVGAVRPPPQAYGAR